MPAPKTPVQAIADVMKKVSELAERMGSLGVFVTDLARSFRALAELSHRLTWQIASIVGAPRFVKGDLHYALSGRKNPSGHAGGGTAGTSASSSSTATGDKKTWKSSEELMAEIRARHAEKERLEEESDRKRAARWQSINLLNAARQEAATKEKDAGEEKEAKKYRAFSVISAAKKEADVKAKETADAEMQVRKKNFKKVLDDEEGAKKPKKPGAPEMVAPKPKEPDWEALSPGATAARLALPPETPEMMETRKKQDTIRDAISTKEKQAEKLQKESEKAGAAGNEGEVKRLTEELRLLRQEIDKLHTEGLQLGGAVSGHASPYDPAFAQRAVAARTFAKTQLGMHEAQLAPHDPNSSAYRNMVEELHAQMQAATPPPTTPQPTTPPSATQQPATPQPTTPPLPPLVAPSATPQQLPATSSATGQQTLSEKLVSNVIKRLLGTTIGATLGGILGGPIGSAVGSMAGGIAAGFFTSKATTDKPQEDPKGGVKQKAGLNAWQQALSISQGPLGTVLGGFLGEALGGPMGELLGGTLGAHAGYISNQENLLPHAWKHLRRFWANRKDKTPVASQATSPSTTESSPTPFVGPLLSEARTPEEIFEHQAQAARKRHLEKGGLGSELPPHNPSAPAYRAWVEHEAKRKAETEKPTSAFPEDTATGKQAKATWANWFSAFYKTGDVAHLLNPVINHITGGKTSRGDAEALAASNNVPAMTALAEAAQKVVRVFLGMSAAAQGLMQAASPDIWQTFTMSLELLAGYIGQTLIPFFVELCADVQAAANWFNHLDPGIKDVIGRLLKWSLIVAGATVVIGGLVAALSLLFTPLGGLASLLVTLGALLEELCEGLHLLDPKKKRTWRDVDQSQELKDARKEFDETPDPNQAKRDQMRTDIEAGWQKIKEQGAKEGILWEQPPDVVEKANKSGDWKEQVKVGEKEDADREVLNKRAIAAHLPPIDNDDAIHYRQDKQYGTYKENFRAFLEQKRDETAKEAEWAGTKANAIMFYKPEWIKHVEEQNEYAGRLQTGAANLGRWLKASPDDRERFYENNTDFAEAKKQATIKGVKLQGPEFEAFVAEQQNALLKEADKIHKETTPYTNVQNRPWWKPEIDAQREEQKRLYDQKGVSDTRRGIYDQWLSGNAKTGNTEETLNKLMLALPSIKSSPQYMDIEGAHKRVQMAALADDPITTELKRMQQESLKQLIDNTADLPPAIARFFNYITNSGPIK